MKLFIKNNIKIVVAVIVTAIISVTTTAYASRLLASDISFVSEKTTVTNINDALDELYSKADKSNVTSGEAFLIMSSGDGIVISHNYTSYTAFVHKKNLDFSNIKSFKYSYDINTTNPSYQNVKLTNSTTTFININLSNSGLVEINGATNVTFAIQLSMNYTGTFKVSEYTTMDGVVHTL